MDRLCTLFVLLTTAAHVCTPTKFRNCGSTADVNSVNISNCPDSMNVCPLIRDTDPNITIAFTSNSESKNVYAIARGILFNFNVVKLLISEPDGCKGGIVCPVQKRTSYAYITQLEVKNSYPRVPLTFRLSLKDDNWTNLVCVTIPCKVKGAS
ncbi:Epididymal secretory protein E1, partial [Stegodyphus mimosarum]